MSDELDTHEQRLADLFSQVSAPPSMRRWESGAVRNARSWWSRPLRALVSVGGETRLRPLAAALVLPVTVLAVAGGLQIHTHFGGAAGQGGDPPARSGAAMAYDAAHHQVVMFGGATGYGGTELSDTWTWDGSSWTEQHPAVNPGARQDATMAFDAAHNEVVLYGGSEYRPPAGSGLVNDTWAWDGSNWHRVVTAHAPAATGTAGLAYDSQRNQLLLVVEQFASDSFGGGIGFASGSGSAAPGSLHGVAAPVPHLVPAPTPAANNGSTGGSVTNVFGSISGGLNQGGAAGASSSAHAGVEVMPAQPQGSSLISHGPPMQANAALETWVFTGSDWQRLSPQSTPSGISQVAMPAFDGTAKHLVLLTAAVTPLVMHQQCLATAMARGSGVASPPTLAPSFPPGLPIRMPSARPLPPVSAPPVDAPPPACATTTQGNVAPMRVAGQVEWAWDGSNWNQPPTTKGANAPFGVRLASDPTSGRLLAVGALSTWTWTGSTWKLQQNPGGLARRTGFALAGDPDSNQVVLFGGRVGGIAGSDTWTWDGKKWTHRSGTTPPPVPTPYPLPPQPATVAPCSESVQFVRQADGTVQVTVTLPSPYTTAQCVDASGVVLTLVDSSGKKAAITGNDFAMGNSIGAVLSWSNWCGSPVTRALLEGKHLHMDAVVTATPVCTDAHKPSTLTDVTRTDVIP